MQKVETSAPGKLMLFGDHSVVYGHPCIVTAIDQRIRVSATKSNQPTFSLSAPDLGLKEYLKPMEELAERDVPKSVSFLENLYKVFLEEHPQKGGITIETKSDFLSTFGFGSSSAVTAAFGRALTELYEIEADNFEIFRWCYQAVLNVQGVGSGFDIAAALWGGTLYYVTPAKTVDVLPVDQLPMTVGYTGIKADTPTIVRMVQTQRDKYPDKIENIFSEITAITELARQAIKIKDWLLVGELMTKNQELLNELQVSSQELDSLITAANEAGAYGAKLSGAGGGDCMIALASDSGQSEIENAIEHAGGEVMRVQSNAPGVRVESRD
jgi:mevalonate kinase